MKLSGLAIADHLSERNAQSIGIDGNSQTDALVFTNGWLHHEASSFGSEILNGLIQILHRESQACGSCDGFSTRSRGGGLCAMQRECRGTQIELAPFRRLKLELQPERALVETDRAIHVGHHYDRHHVVHQ